jgi:nitronate monooxygenase
VLALGADAAWLGTRFVASEEAPFAAEYKQRVVAAAETESIYTTLFDGGWPNAPHRVLHNSTVADWEAAGRPAPGARPAEGEMATPPDGEAIPRYSVEEPTLGMTGDLEALALYAGQSAGLVQAVEPAATIVQRLVDKAETVLHRLAGPERTPTPRPS